MKTQHTQSHAIQGKVVLRGKFVAENAYIKKEEQSLLK